MTSIGERDQLKNAKIAVLKLINEHKEILFGKLSETLTREVKESKWAEVAEHAHNLGAFPLHRSWDYLKDTTWQNWRKRFVEKREKKEKFEKAGIGSKVIYDEADLLIMEIVDAIGGRNVPYSSNQANYSSMYSMTDPSIRDISDMLEIEFDVKTEGNDAVDGGQTNFQSTNTSQLMPELDQRYSVANPANMIDDLANGHEEDIHTTYESQDNQSNLYVNTNGNDSRVNANDSTQQQPKIVSTSSLAANSRVAALRKSAFNSLRTGSTSRKRGSAFISNPNVSHGTGQKDSELVELKCRKLRAELDILYKESYKKDLEILQLERSLGLPASNITKKFFRESRTSNSIMHSTNPNQ